MREGRRSLSFNSSLEIGVGEAKGWNTKFLRGFQSFGFLK